MEDLVSSRKPDRDFWSKQRVLLTGHTGFKGSWLCAWLARLGAEVTGLALAPDTDPNLSSLLGSQPGLNSIIADIRDPVSLREAVIKGRPTVAIHMAAQPLVRRSYREPVETISINVLGTAAVLDALQQAADLSAVLVITTDKVYRNLEDGRAFLEDDPLGGHDPYSASKAAAEIIASSWAQSFFTPRGARLGTARAGNVIGGGDWSEDRLVPDVWRAAHSGAALELRYPNATRPWQHVLDPLCGYLLYVEDLVRLSGQAPPSLNFGPPLGEVMTVGDVASAVLKAMGQEQPWARSTGDNPAEMKYLALDSSLATSALGWKSQLSSAMALEWTADWYRAFDLGNDMKKFTYSQIESYEGIIIRS